MKTTINNSLSDTDFDHLMVKSDNATRWNSAYEMVNRGIKLQRRIDLFCYEQGKAIDNADKLSIDDWATLISVTNILKPFKEETMKLQGHGASGSYGTTWEVLPTIYGLLKHIREQERHWLTVATSMYQDPQDHHIYHSLVQCRQKLEKYQDLCFQSPIYAAATVMNPTKKWSWFSQRRPEYKGLAEREVQQIWDDFYRDRPQNPAPPPAMPTTSHRNDSDNDSLDDEP